MGMEPIYEGMNFFGVKKTKLIGAGYGLSIGRKLCEEANLLES